MSIRLNYRIPALPLIALILISAGCSTQESANTPIQTVVTQPVTDSDTTVNTPAIEETEEPTEQSGKKELTISSPTDSINDSDELWDDPYIVNDTSSTNGKSEPAKLPNYDVTEPFDQARLTLMGFSINDSADALIARFGQPTTQTAMKDGVDTLNVLVYPGFNFGIDASKSIVFIEVTSELISPGLNTFKIGQSVEEAQKALGPADSLNDFVMIYEKNNITLKCDLDPNNRTVISIKLFAS